MVDEIFEDREDVPAVADHAIEQFAQLRFARGLFIPLCQNRRRNFYVSAQLFRGMPTQKQPVEKRRLALREVEIPYNVFNRVGQRCHNESAVYRFRRSRQEATCVTGK